jgi:hypothetical protein
LHIIQINALIVLTATVIGESHRKRYNPVVGRLTQVSSTANSDAAVPRLSTHIEAFKQNYDSNIINAVFYQNYLIQLKPDKQRGLRRRKAVLVIEANRLSEHLY